MSHGSEEIYTSQAIRAAWPRGFQVAGVVWMSSLRCDMTIRAGMQLGAGSGLYAPGGGYFGKVPSSCASAHHDGEEKSGYFGGATEWLRAVSLAVTPVKNDNHLKQAKTMEKKNEIKIFEARMVRTLWDADQEKWYLSIVDVIAVLTDSPNPRKYWSVLKTRLKAEGSQLATNCSQLKMQSADGKFYLTDVADTEQLFRLIQSIPSPKAEPFKLWLAQVAAERLDEMQDPELSIDRALEQYLQLGYSENWINQRLKSIEIRKELTDEWKKRGLKEGVQFATLTDIITKAWSDKTTKEYKILKGLKKENLRDNMTNTELILNMLAEASTKDISAAVEPKDFEESKKVAKQGGNVARVALKELEARTGKKVISKLNAKTALSPKQIEPTDNKSKKR